MKEKNAERFAAEFVVEALERLDRKPDEPKYYDAICLKVTFNKNHIVCRPVGEEDKEKYPREWARFQATPAYKKFHGENPDSDHGEPHTELDVLEGVGPATQRQLEEVGIRSVEQLAKATDDELSEVRNGEALRDKAREYLTD